LKERNRVALDIKKRFISYLRVEKGRSQNTLTAYETDLEKLINFANASGKDLLSIERDDLLRFIKTLQESGLQPKSVARTLATVRSLYHFLLLDGILKRDPSANIETPKSWQSLPKFLMAEEV
jgi:integrase/recombinase XerD